MLKMAQRQGDPNLWAEYRELRNRVTREEPSPVGVSKRSFHGAVVSEDKDDWRQAIARKHVVGVVFVDFRKAFDAIPKTSESYCSWGLMVLDKDYLSGRTQVKTINGCQSQAMQVTFGLPQGTVLGPTLFAIFCNYLPNITEGIDGDPQLHMYADDTTVYVSAPTYDLVPSKLHEVLAGLYTWCCENCLTPHPTKLNEVLARLYTWCYKNCLTPHPTKLNEVLARLYTWCCENCLTPHPTKTEYMLLGGREQFTGPKQAIKMGDYAMEVVVSTRCLGVQIDNALKWDHHVSELAKSYTQKLSSIYLNPCISYLNRQELISILRLFCRL
ncbi:RNA-directed DNA polymerase from mobile element jockey [Stylophora pistillata]|uniref:RNA-directed DNA polymerase from mobile element jockey n=1 Tax=Stylophora pistillata TaxID=50429 RepID=A0A2B4R2F0_STYPI|nr:RNA-directed DNA polymerase from mobile element jockey [Stylophora pistillata]